MQAVSAAYIAEARDVGGVQDLRVEWLDSTTRESKQDLALEVVEGRVTVENGAEGRRHLQMTLMNPGGMWTPTNAPLSEPLFMNNLIRVSLGLNLSGAVEYCPLGTFRVNRPYADAQERTITVDAQDLWKDFSWGLKQTARFAPGSTLNSCISAIAANAGIIDIDLDPAGDGVRLQSAPAPSLKFRRGMRMADCFAVLAGDFGWQFYFDVLGKFVTRASVPIDQQATVFELLDTHACFTRGRGGLEDSPDIYNHVGVSSTDPVFPSAFGEAMDDDPASPTYYKGPFGDRYHEEEYDGVQTTGQAREAARELLRRTLYLSRSVEVDTNALPFLDVQDVVSLTVADLKINATRYFVDSIDIPLDRGTQTMRLLEARSIGL